MTAPRTPSILSLGEALWDVFPDGARFGGAPANFACHAAALGARVVMASVVGNDERGREALDIMRGYGIDVRTVQVSEDAPTGLVSVSVDGGGKPNYTIEENAAWDFLQWTDFLAAAIAGADAVYFGTLGQRSPRSRETIRRALVEAERTGTMRVLDVNLRAPFFDEHLIRDSVAFASVLKLSNEELEAVASACEIPVADSPESVLRGLVEKYGLDLAIMTRGAEGALLVSADESWDQPGIPVEVHDTVGAGDAFTASLVTGLLRGESLPELARRSCALAGAVCTQPGAVPHLDSINKTT